MTLLQYLILLALAVVGIIGYAMVAAAANADREYEQDEHEQMLKQIETRKEFRK